MSQADDLQNPGQNRVKLSPEVETPYSRGQRIWDDRLGSVVMQAKNWRLAFFGLLPVTFLAVGWGLYQTGQHRDVPVPILVDRVTGDSQSLGPINNFHYTATDQNVSSAIRNWIEWTRSVSIDPVVVKQNNFKARAFLLKESTAKLNLIQQQWEPLQKVGQLPVQVDNINVQRIPGSASWTASWDETVYNRDGAVVDKYRENMTITVLLGDPPSKEPATSINPFGIYFPDFNPIRQAALPNAS